MVEHGRRLLAADSREPLQELLERRAVPQILEQRPDRDARATKYPRSADHVGVGFDGRTCAPMSHVLILPSAAQPRHSTFFGSYLCSRLRMTSALTILSGAGWLAACGLIRCSLASTSKPSTTRPKTVWRLLR